MRFVGKIRTGTGSIIWRDIFLGNCWANRQVLPFGIDKDYKLFNAFRSWYVSEISNDNWNQTFFTNLDIEFDSKIADDGTNLVTNVKFLDQEYTIDTLNSDALTGTIHPTATILLFAIRQTNTPTADQGYDGTKLYATRANTRFYWFKIFSDNELILDLIPVLDNVLNEGCMFDRVSGKIFRNPGVGKFLFG